MDRQLLNALTARMAAASPDYHTAHKAATTMVARSLEASMGTLVALTAACRASGEVTPETARAVGDGAVRVFAPDTGDQHSWALALETPGGNYIAILTMRGKPNPAMDAIMAGIYQSMGISEQEQRARADAYAASQAAEHKIRARSVAVARYWPPFPGWTGPLPTDAEGVARAVAWRQKHAATYRPTYQEVIEKARQNAYFGTVFKTSTSMEPFRDEGETLWSPGVAEMNSVDDWMIWFPALHQVIPAYGLGERFTADASAYAERRFESYTDFDAWVAAQELGDLLAREDGYLPRGQAVAVLRDIEGRVAASAIERCLDDLKACLEGCRAHGHTSHDTEFSHNDLDNAVFAPDSGRDDLALLAFNDQNCCFLVALTPDGRGGFREIAVHRYGDSVARWLESGYQFKQGITEQALDGTSFDSRDANPYGEPPVLDYEGALAACLAGDATSPSLLHRFVLDPETGTACLRSVPKLDGESIRGWNAFLGDVNCAAICLEEDYAPKRAPGSGR